MKYFRSTGLYNLFIFLNVFFYIILIVSINRLVFGDSNGLTHWGIHCCVEPILLFFYAKRLGLVVIFDVLSYFVLSSLAIGWFLLLPISKSLRVSVFLIASSVICWIAKLRRNLLLNVFLFKNEIVFDIVVRDFFFTTSHNIQLSISTT